MGIQREYNGNIHIQDMCHKKIGTIMGIVIGL